jgi:hypothetical protein
MLATGSGNPVLGRDARVSGITLVSLRTAIRFRQRGKWSANRHLPRELPPRVIPQFGRSGGSQMAAGLRGLRLMLVNDTENHAPGPATFCKDGQVSPRRLCA